MSSLGETEICNAALRRVRGGRIDSYKDEDTSLAEDCRTFYPQVLGVVLEDFDWNFAKAVQPLALKTETATEWLYVYDYPSQCAAARYIVEPFNVLSGTSGGVLADINLTPDWKIKYRIGLSEDQNSKVILTNQENAYLAYTAHITNTALMTFAFTTAMSWALGAELALSIGGDSAKAYRDVALQEYNLLKMKAQEQSGNEDNDRRMVIPRNISVRNNTMGDDYFRNGLAYRGR